MGTLTILALVAQEVRRAAAGWLVSSTDSTVTSIRAVILTGVQVTVRSCKSCQTSTGRRACGRTHILYEGINRTRQEACVLGQQKYLSVPESCIFVVIVALALYLTKILSSIISNDNTKRQKQFEMSLYYL